MVSSVDMEGPGELFFPTSRMLTPEPMGIRIISYRLGYSQVCSRQVVSSNRYIRQSKYAAKFRSASRAV